MQKITIYTDGAARGNPGPSGWGSIIMMDKKMTELGGRKAHGTNNQMELTAPIKALEYLNKHKIKGEVKIFSDSKYVILGITEWIPNWIKNGWKNAAKKPVLNRELWEELYILNKEYKPEWEYVKGHSGHEHNDRVDEIATSFADEIKIELKKDI